MSEDDITDDLPISEKIRALYRIAKFWPVYASGIVCLSVIAALLEGFGLSFILPIIEVVQASGTPLEDADGILGIFLGVYELLGISFTLGYLVAGVGLIMTVRFSTSFLVGWLRAAIETQYVRYLQIEAFDHALDARLPISIRRDPTIS